MPDKMRDNNYSGEFTSKVVTVYLTDEQDMDKDRICVFKYQKRRCTRGTNEIK